MAKEKPEEDEYRKKFLEDFQKIQDVHAEIPKKKKELKKKAHKQKVNFRKKIRIKKKKAKTVKLQVKQNERLITRTQGMRRKIANMDEVLKEFGNLIDLPQKKWSEVLEQPEKYGVEKEEIEAAQQLIAQYQATMKEIEKSANIPENKRGSKKARRKLGKRSKLGKKGMASRKKWLQM